MLCPTRELVQQVAAVGKELCHNAKFRVCEVSGAKGWAQQRKDLDKGVDLLVSTPSRVLQLIDSGLLASNNSHPSSNLLKQTEGPSLSLTTIQLC